MATGWSASMVTVKASTAFASMISGEFALSGPPARLVQPMSRLLITIEEKSYGADAYSSRRASRRRAWRIEDVGRGAGATDQCPGESHHRDHERSAQHYGRYGASSWPLVWHQCRILVEPAEAVRTPARTAGNRR